MSVFYVYKEVYDNKSIKIDVTSHSNTNIFGNTPEHNVKSLFYGDKGTTRICQLMRPHDQNNCLLNGHKFC